MTAMDVNRHMTTGLPDTELILESTDPALLHQGRGFTRPRWLRPQMLRSVALPMVAS
jgi:hypothetical protein